MDEADLVCPRCGGDLQEMKGQSEDAEEIDVVERRLVVRKHKRLKYRCKCNSCVDTAPGVAAKGSYASAEALQWLFMLTRSTRYG